MPAGLRFPLSLLARMLALFSAYVLLADTTQEPELFVGAFCAITIGTAWTIILRRRAHIRVPARALLRAPRALPALLTDTVRVSWALGRSIVRREPLRGRLRVASYAAAAGDDAEDRGRRLLTQWGASLGANRYVIGIDPERGEVIVHELVPDDSPLDPMGWG